MARALSIALLAAPALIGAAPDAEVSVELTGLRNARGTVLLCLSGDPRHFPDCGADPAARTIRVRAAEARRLVFGGVAPGDYALSVMHDENGNAKLDTTLAIPREGFGFSRNPVVRFGPPRYKDVRFTVRAGANRVGVRMKYFL